MKKLSAATKKVNESGQVDRSADDKKFDDICFTELSDIFNKNAKWKSIATALGYQDYMENWQKLRNPTKVLLTFTEVISIEFIFFLHFNRY